MRLFINTGGLYFTERACEALTDQQGVPFVEAQDWKHPIARARIVGARQRPRFPLLLDVQVLNESDQWAYYLSDFVEEHLGYPAEMGFQVLRQRTPNPLNVVDEARIHEFMLSRESLRPTPV